ncbi:hypothetical protein [Nitrospirillum amazonense]|uniref:hypothetical protein n=1 Tax=Nitrospirillum amazonense TaxID=28077 RepID=UPI002412B166|nr:hypothetical protein [Nitrospirillum amazonense]MDG3443702.1 hypothetical protein [Nitrospirillum amazonense]
MNYQFSPAFDGYQLYSQPLKYLNPPLRYGNLLLKALHRAIHVAPGCLRAPSLVMQFPSACAAGNTMSLFRSLRERTGLSRSEAAFVFSVRNDTIYHYDKGRNPAPEGILQAMRGYIARLDEQAELMAKAYMETDEWKAGQRDVTLLVAETTPQANLLGWPALGMQRSFINRVADRLTLQGANCSFRSYSSGDAL